MFKLPAKQIECWYCGREYTTATQSSCPSCGHFPSDDEYEDEFYADDENDDDWEDEEESSDYEAFNDED